jgi:protein-disulfide isomerase
MEQSTTPVLPDDLWNTRAKLDMFAEYKTSAGLMTEPSFGSENAAATLVEYFDYECPACRQAAAVIDFLKQTFPRDLQVVYRFFPLDSACNPNIQNRMHAASCYLSKYALCADEQGAFQTVHSLIFELAEAYPDSSALQQAFDQALASQPLDLEALRSCVASGRADAKIALDIKSATRLNVPGTPSIFINGVKMEQPSAERLKAAVQQYVGKTE